MYATFCILFRCGCSEVFYKIYYSILMKWFTVIGSAWIEKIEEGSVARHEVASAVSNHTKMYLPTLYKVAGFPRVRCKIQLFMQ